MPGGVAGSSPAIAFRFRARKERMIGRGWEWAGSSAVPRSFPPDDGHDASRRALPGSAYAATGIWHTLPRLCAQIHTAPRYSALNIVEDVANLPGCIHHRNRPTALRCNKCEQPICPKCIIQTPVGARCRECAQLRRLPQFDIRPAILARSLPAGLGVSLLGWFLLSYVPYLRFFLAILLGVAVGGTIARLSKRRSGLVLEVGAVAVVAIGFAANLWWTGEYTFFTAGAHATFPLALIFPVVIASFVAVVKLR